MGVYQLYEELDLPVSREELWDFISSPANLKVITPDYMGFDIISSPLPDKIYPGLMISYWVRPVLGIRMNWLTEITHIKELEYFVDEQRSGPYAIWHHEHRLLPMKSGTRMTDLVTYRLPLGPLGKMAHGLFVKKQLEGIFQYREQVLKKRFGSQK